MVRPTGSPINRRLALEFAKLVTRHTGNDDDLVARCGRCSLFSTLQEIFPSVVRDESGGARDGLSEVEFNKLLQASGFRRVRNRKAGASNRAQDPLGAGLYMFSGIRWLNPDEPAEVKLLASGLAHLAACFPHLGLHASGGLDLTLTVVRRNRRWWDESAWQRARRRRAQHKATAGSFMEALTSPSMTSASVSRSPSSSCSTAGEFATRTSDIALSTDTETSDGAWFDDCSDSSPAALPRWPRAASSVDPCSACCDSQPTERLFSLSFNPALSEHSAPACIPVAFPAADAQRCCWRWAWEDGELWPAGGGRAEWCWPGSWIG